MKKRIITAAVLVPALVALLLFGNSVAIALAIAVVSVMGLIEFYKAVGLQKHRVLCFFCCVAGAVIPLLPIIIKAFAINEMTKSMIGLMCYVFILILFVIMLVCYKKVSVTDVSLAIFALIYISYFLTNILYIRQMERGHFLIWLVFIGAFLTDSCAYFVGTFCGKHKLCPNISPKKTVEGAIGGVIGCMLFYVLYGLLMKYAFMVDVSLIKLSILGFMVSIVAVIGDLVASVIKRHYGIKDYGTLFPGHGGILDRCDSLILVAPIVYLFLRMVGIF